MTINLKLDEECGKCGGCGERYNFHKPQPTQEICPDCNGSGLRLTEEGRELMEFLGRHKAALRLLVGTDPHV